MESKELEPIWHTGGSFAPSFRDLFSQHRPQSFEWGFCFPPWRLLAPRVMCQRRGVAFPLWIGRMIFCGDGLPPFLWQNHFSSEDIWQERVWKVILLEVSILMCSGVLRHGLQTAYWALAQPTLFIDILDKTVRDRAWVTGCQQFWSHLIFSFTLFSFLSVVLKLILFISEVNISHLPKGYTSSSLTRFKRHSWACGPHQDPSFLPSWEGPLAPSYRPISPLLNVASKFSLLEQFHSSIFPSRLLTGYSRSSFSFCFWEVRVMHRPFFLLFPGHHFFPPVEIIFTI